MARIPMQAMPGGLTLPTRRSQDLRRHELPLRELPLPERLLIPLLQADGEQARALVSVGDMVLRGQAVARWPDGRQCHAPSSGLVSSIGHEPCQQTAGLLVATLVISPDGLDRACTPTPWRSGATLNEDNARGNSDDAPGVGRTHHYGDMLAHLRSAGIGNLAGGGFAAASEWPASADDIDTLVLNAIRPAADMMADDYLLCQHADEVLSGARLLAQGLGCVRLVIILGEDQPEALAAIEAVASADIDILVAPARYPSAALTQVVLLSTGRDLPNQTATSSVGVFVVAVATALATKRALVDGLTLTERTISISGIDNADTRKSGTAKPGTERPSIWLARIGTPIADILQHAGLPTQTIGEIRLGGALAGTVLATAAAPMLATTAALHVSADNAEDIARRAAACIRCGDCADVCPAQLLPQQLFWHSRNGQTATGSDPDRVVDYGLDACFECGACTAVCPSEIPLLDYFRQAKGERQHAAQEQERAARARQRFQAHSQRLAAIDAERQARRLARQAAAAHATAAAAQAAASTAASTTTSTTTATPATALAPGAQTAMPHAAAEIPALMIAAALARSQLKKCEKQISSLQARGEDSPELTAQLPALQAAVSAAEAALEQAKARAGGSTS